jgi:hypothetical protein
MNNLRFSLMLALLFCCSLVATAQKAKPSPSPVPSVTPPPPPTPTPTPTVKTVSTYQKEKLCSPKCEAGIGNRIVVHIENLPPEANVKDYVIFLDGQPIKGVLGVPVNGSASLISEPNPTPIPIATPPSDKAKPKPTPDPFLLEFELMRTTESRDAWAALLGSPSLTNPFRRVVVSVGDPAKGPLTFSNNNQKPEISLRAYHRRWLIGMSIAVLGAIALFVYLAKSTNIIRDSNPPSPPEGKQRPYSLALTQAAVWFFLVFGSFLFIGLVTGDYDTITEQALILMGIGTGTALGAAMIDSTKRSTADSALSTLEPKKAQLEEEVKQLEAKVQSLAGATTDAGKQTLADTSVQLKEKQALLKDTIDDIAAAKSGLSKPVSEGFFRDLLTDADGVNFHRFQMLVWTVVLGVLFVIGVYKGLSMPVFSATLLALMGISAGTYLGFKIPEKQS